MYWKIKLIDPNHPISSGMAEPRPEAMNLFRAAISGRDPDWKQDDFADREEYMRIVNEDVDIVSIHYYAIEPNPGLAWYNRVAKKMGKPLLVGELGINHQIIWPDYNSSEGIRFVERAMREITENDIPTSCWWLYTEQNSIFQLYYGVSDTALRKMEGANIKLRLAAIISRPASPIVPSYPVVH